MLTRPLLIVLAFLVLTGGATAARPPATLRLTGRVTADLMPWARAAAANVPLPTAHLTVQDGSALFEGSTIYLPFAWSKLTVHGLFLHELGHAYDRYDMNAQRRRDFLRIADVTCTWTAPHCRTARWVSGPGVYVDVRPQEMFAEMYAACALGLTERGYQDAGYNTYGWVPPDGTDVALCAVIRGQPAPTG